MRRGKPVVVTTDHLGGGFQCRGVASSVVSGAALSTRVGSSGSSNLTSTSTRSVAQHIQGVCMLTELLEEDCDTAWKLREGRAMDLLHQLGALVSELRGHTAAVHTTTRAV